jgi:hypothetical protein
VPIGGVFVADALVHVVDVAVAVEVARDGECVAPGPPHAVRQRTVGAEARLARVGDDELHAEPRRFLRLASDLEHAHAAQHGGAEAVHDQPEQPEEGHADQQFDQGEAGAPACHRACLASALSTKR